MSAIWFVPVRLAAFGALGFVGAWWVSRRFDRRYPHLSRTGQSESALTPQPPCEHPQPRPTPQSEAVAAS